MINHWKNYAKSILFISSLLHMVMIEGANSLQFKSTTYSNTKIEESLRDCVHIQTKPFKSLGIPEHLFKGMPTRNQKQNLLINGKDKRKCIKELYLPLQPNKKENITRYIVQLYMTFGGEPYVGTGTIIDIHEGKCWILTAAHNLATYSKKYEEKLQAENVYFTFLGKKDKYQCTDYFIHPTYDAENGTGKDIALLVSSTCQVTVPTVFPLLQCIEKGKYTGYVIGYPGEEEKRGALWGMEDNIIVNKKDEIIYTIATTAGQSGSPILCLMNNVYYIVGVHTHGEIDCNYGTKITEKVFEWICLASNIAIKDIKKRIQKHQIPLNNLPKMVKYINLNSRNLELLDIEFLLNRLVWGYCQHYYFRDQYLSPDIIFCITQYLGERNCCIIHGEGGVGKSTLALLYGHKHLKKQTYQQIWWIDFFSLDNNLDEIIRLLNGNQYAYYMPTILQKKQYIKEILNDLSQWLLIMDNVPPQITSIKNLLPSRGGHILITTRDNRAIWNHLGIRYAISGLSQESAYNLLKQFAPSQSQQEKNNIYDLANSLHYMPLALRNVGYYIQNQRKANVKNTYANCADFFKSKKEIIGTTNTDLLNIKLRIFGIFLNIIKQIAMYEKESGRETLYILTIMAYLNTYGFSPDFVACIAPWQSQWFSYHLGKPIGKERAQKAIQILMKYGILNSKEYRIHRFCQEATRTWAQKILGKSQKETEKWYQFMHNIFPYGHKSVELSAVKVLENIYEKTTSESPLRIMAIDHAFAMKEHVQHNKSLCNRLLHITN